MKSMSIKPCILVTERISVDRAVKYDRTEIFCEEHSDGSEDAAFTTNRHFANRAETKRAMLTYNRVRRKLESVCVRTRLGLICAVEKADGLHKALAEARQIVDEANDSFEFCSVAFDALLTRVEPSNLSGSVVVRDAIANSVKIMRTALNDFDVSKVREALRSTKHMVSVLESADARKELVGVREETRTLLKDVAKVVKEFGSAVNALHSADGKNILQRVNAPWNF